MPVEPRGTGDRETIAPSHEIIRLIEGLDGEVEFEVVLRPTFDFARKETTTTIIEAGVIASSGDERLWLRSPARLSVQPTGEVSGRFRAAAGERLWVTLAYGSDDDNNNRRAMSDQEAEAALSRTLRYWNQWSELCTYRGPYEDLVRRSALTLKLLTFNPTGALVASPTTSLPEEIGGARNWDYRFTWLRDSSLILDALHGIGYQQEAVDFFDWLDDLSVKREERVRIMYTVTGQAVPLEQALDHLEGYRRSRPVRVGNAAATQVQLDVSGEILEAAHLCYSRLRAIQPDLWRVLARDG
jgi:GH15 family glucan-1,4-alpha-glucosidase